MRKQFLFLLILVYLFSGCRKNPVLLEEVLAYSGANRPELEKVINEQAAKGYRLHTITTTASGSKGFLGGDRIQTTMVFESL